MERRTTVVVECPYTLDDLEKAREELRLWQGRFGDDSSNNPNKYRREIGDAANEVEKIEWHLKESGILSRPTQELLDLDLDRLYPDAKSRLIVNHQGKRYQIRYFKVRVCGNTPGGQ